MDNAIFSETFSEKLQSVLYSRLETAPISASKLAEELELGNNLDAVNVVQLAVRTLLPEVQSSRRWGFYLTSTPKTNTNAGRKRKHVDVPQDFVDRMVAVLSAEPAPIAVSRLVQKMELDPVSGTRLVQRAIKEGYVSVTKTKGPKGGISLVRQQESTAA